MPGAWPASIAVYADQRGLPAIVCLCAVCAALVAWSITDLAGDARARKAAQVAERNLGQAEDMLKACFRNAFFTIGTAIYVCEARESELTTDQVPEVGGS